MRAAALAGAVLTTFALTAVPAGATPGSGVTGVIISQTTVGDKDIILREITLAPRTGSTGWHTHDGTLYALVKQGTLTHTFACDKVDVYHQGAVFSEPAGPDKVHIGQNLGDVPVVLDVVYVLPHGKPLSEDAPDPGCGFP
ncbi:cupin domain-containing protein [Kibdelosporangium lantanae]|uniref:Cupin domain-containing protein n=1 Tax=Kibdelosporangium lantanae TaxID=1497396 RepID=A0ABW3MGT4_9PSEU